MRKIKNTLPFILTYFVYFLGLILFDKTNFIGNSKISAETNSSTFANIAFSFSFSTLPPLGKFLIIIIIFGIIMGIINLIINIYIYHKNKNKLNKKYVISSLMYIVSLFIFIFIFLIVSTNKIQYLGG